MTIFWLKRPRTSYNSTEEAHEGSVETPEYDEDGRRYVFRYERAKQQHYRIDRDRLFTYLATHEMPGVRARSIRRDVRNSGDFFEDVRELQTHADTVAVVREQKEPLTQLRLRSAS